MTAPIIPGLNDSEIPAILEAAKEAGARTASYILVRLPLTVEPVFIEWLQRTQPMQAEKVLSRLKAMRGGRVNSSRWAERMTGRGEIADQIGKMFRLFRQKHGLDSRLPPQNRDLFQPPKPKSGQLRLF